MQCTATAETRTHWPLEIRNTKKNYEQKKTQIKWVGSDLLHAHLSGDDKGHLISKGHFDFFNSSKKRIKKICPSRLGQKFDFSSLFFGRIVDTKKTFRN